MSLAVKSKLSFTDFRKLMSKTIFKWSDERDVRKKKIEQHDVVLSAFACMFYQSSSLLQFQEAINEKAKYLNLVNQFNLTNVPGNTQLREVLDNIPSKKFSSIFIQFHKKLELSEIREGFRNKLDTFFVSVDGTQYYHSKNIFCKKCLIRNKKTGKEYSHQMLQSAVVKPGLKSVLPLIPIEISNASSHDYDKQDCERKALRRFLNSIDSYKFKGKITILLDALYADQYVIKDINELNEKYIIVSKPDDCKYLHEEFWQVTVKKETKIIEEKGYKYEYIWQNNINFNKNKTKVNFLCFNKYIWNSRENKYDKVVYKNSWITNHEITYDNVEEVALGGRARWKIENECFNNLKNRGYHLEHSYGHGEKNLSFNFILLTLLAFLLHQILEKHSDLYKYCYEKIKKKTRLWEKLNAYIEILVFRDFEELLLFTLTPEKYLNNQHIMSKPREGPVHLIEL